MGKLSLSASRLSFASERTQRPTQQAQGPTPNQSSAPWRASYKTKRWRDLRLVILIRDNYTCQSKGCGRVASEGMVIDHKRPHRGDERLFWSASNLQTMCKSPCHDQHKQRLEQESRHHAGVWD